MLDTDGYSLGYNFITCDAYMYRTEWLWTHQAYSQTERSRRSRHLLTVSLWKPAVLCNDSLVRDSRAYCRAN